MHDAERRYLRSVVPVGALFACVLWLGNAAYLHLSVSFIQMLKASMPVAVFFVGVLMKTESYSHLTAFNMLIVGTGIAIASWGELNFVLVGVLLQAGSIACESLRITLVQVRLLPVPRPVQSQSGMNLKRCMVLQPCNTCVLFPAAASRASIYLLHIHRFDPRHCVTSGLGLHP